MGELFARTVPAKPLGWTGERLTTDADYQVEVEHLHRYLFARSMCRDLDVLDVASGEGYGSAFLAQTAKSVVGVELDPAAVSHAEQSYVMPNLRFTQGDARQLPLPDNSVDVVVSFETIEHFYEQERFLDEVRRVLRPGGRFMCSSPERDVYSPANQAPNPFHVRELTRAEFLSLLERRFSEVALLGQRPVLGSALVGEVSQGEGPRPTITFERRSANSFEASDGLPRPVYLVAIASDAPLSHVPNSLYIDRHELGSSASQQSDLNRDLDIAKQALTDAATYTRKLELDLKAHDDTLAQATVYARKLEQELSNHDRDLGDTKAYAAKLERQVELSNEHASKLQTELAARHDELLRLQESHEKVAADLEVEQARCSRLSAAVEARNRAIADAGRNAKRMRRENDIAVNRTEELRAQIAGLNASLSAQESHLSMLREARSRENLEHQDRCAALQAELSRVVDATHVLSQRLEATSAEIDVRSAELWAMRQSTSWRITSPLRSALERSPGARRVLRRGAKLVWWTLSLQLPKRVQARLQSRQTAVSMAAVVAPDRATLLPHTPQPELETSPIADTATIDDAPATPVPLVEPPVPLNRKEIFTRIAQEELASFLEADETLSFVPAAVPDVSVVVVLWNQAHLTLRCLRALQASLDVTLEVILVDNASSDETGLLLSRLSGVSLLKNTDNVGFLLACNQGAASARGRSILLLNSDAFVRPDAIAKALRTLDAESDVGAVGGRLILPSGRLQEAGSIVWSDGSTLGYGRDLDEDASEAMFRHDVDYCSGAFLLTHRNLWEQLGGFDEAFRPAYYEEADYCMRLREIGVRVVYEPEAVADHYEFGSEAKEGDSRKSTLTNRKYFRARHRAALNNQLPPMRENCLFARDHRRSQPRLLVIDNEVPLTELGAGYPRAKEMLRDAASLGWFVTFYPLHQLTFDWRAAREEIPWEIEVMSGWAAPRLAEFLEMRRGFYDAAIISRPNNMALFNQTVSDRKWVIDGVRLIYDAEALFSVREALQSELEGTPLDAADVEANISAEVSIADTADAIISVSTAEAEAFRGRQSTRVHVLGYPARAVADPTPFAGRLNFLFVGRLLEQHVPNWKGLAWFVRECWPLIRAELPQGELTVVGSLHPDHAELDGPGIRFLGPVENLHPLYEEARVFIAPIQFAAGVPIKILDATAAGLPTVGTKLMCRQLAWTAGIDIMAEDDAASFATAATNLHEDAAVWEAVRLSSRKRLAKDYDPEIFKQRLQAILDGSDA